MAYIYIHIYIYIYISCYIYYYSYILLINLVIIVINTPTCMRIYVIYISWLPKTQNDGVGYCSSSFREPPCIYFCIFVIFYHWAGGPSGQHVTRSFFHFQFVTYELNIWLNNLILLIWECLLQIKVTRIGIGKYIKNSCNVERSLPYDQF